MANFQEKELEGLRKEKLDQERQIEMEVASSYWNVSFLLDTCTAFLF